MTAPARRIIISRRALRDLDAIWSYLAVRAVANIAGDVVAAILDSLESLAQMPGMGHRRDDVANRRYRFWTTKSYVIGYRFDATALRVVRVVHGSRNLARFFR
jgi:antitoxin ParD1/3/4/toxin ParE1/3/4